MTWIHEHAAELNALGSIVMNCSTLMIIYFNINQLKLNSRSLNVDINFKVFDLRKKLYRDIQLFIKKLNADHGLRQHLIEKQDGDYDCSSECQNLIESVDNYKYLFSKPFALKLELLILKIEKGVEIEHKISRLKHKDSSTWTAEDQEEIHKLGDRGKDIMATIFSFDLNEFLPYLNVSNFHANLMESDVSAKPESKSYILIKLFKLLFYSLFKRRLKFN